MVFLHDLGVGREVTLYEILGLVVLGLLAYLWVLPSLFGGSKTPKAKLVKGVWKEIITTNPRDQEECVHQWGFANSGFVCKGSDDVRFKGASYVIGGARFSKFGSFMTKVFGRDLLSLAPVKQDMMKDSEIPTPKSNEPFLNAVRNTKISFTQDAQIRLRQSHGHTQREMYEIKFGDKKAKSWRVADGVAYPGSEEEVVTLVNLASKHNVVVVPYGGGSSVSWCLMLPQNESRFILSVNTQKLDKITILDTVNMYAEVQAGCYGRNIERIMERHGVTLGHEPDSIEFSTMGGWIATHSSGMKKNRYGNIEDIVLDVKVVMANGEVRRKNNVPFPRESVTLDFKRLLFGSEGNLGIILSATCRIRPLPELKIYGSIIFPSYEVGQLALRELDRQESVPASLRLFDNLQFQLSQVLKPDKSALGKLKSATEKFIVLNLLGFRQEKMTAATYICEGPAKVARATEKKLLKIAKSFGGMSGGGSNGEAGYQLTFAIAYLRDWLNKHYVLAESFETSVPWDKVQSVLTGIHKDFLNEWNSQGCEGKKYFLTSRVTQVYTTGVCIYFYLGICSLDTPKGWNPLKFYEHCEHFCRESILRHGGNLSHHHGIGKVRKQFAKGIANENAVVAMQNIKKALDPGNIFGAQNNFIGLKL